MRESEANRRERWRTNFLRDHDFTVSQTEDQSSRVSSPCSNKVRSTWAEFYILKPAFKKARMTMIGFEGMFTSAHGSAVGRVIQWLKCQLLSLLQLDH